MSSWFNENLAFDHRSINNFFEIEAAAHFSQMIWANTTHVGCGRTNFQGKTFIVCNYGPAGNRRNEKVFEEGPHCSKCLKNCGKKFDGLCSDAKIVPPFIAPFNIVGGSASLIRINGLMFVLGLIWTLRLTF